MKHIVIQVESIMKYPPTLSLLKMLDAMGEETILLSSEIDDRVKQECEKTHTKLVNLKYSYNSSESVLAKFMKIPFIKRAIKKTVTNEYGKNSLIWVMTSITLKYIGNILHEKKYVMYMYELYRELRFHPKVPILKVNLEKLFREATIVIECEYNRANIAQAWFGLEKRPYVMPNKPYIDMVVKNSPITDTYSRKILELLKEKKIILYQGIVDKERPLTPFIEAVEELGEEYALLIMSSDIKKLEKNKSKNLYLLPFVAPPKHLEITSWAYIGILTYFPVRNATTSPLNAIYCAPNKIYEYSMFGIPMLGNDIPGLKYTIEENQMGRCFKTFDKKTIICTIKDIEKNYKCYEKHTRQFYQGTNNYILLEEIIRDVRANLEEEDESKNK